MMMMTCFLIKLPCLITAESCRPLVFAARIRDVEEDGGLFFLALVSQDQQPKGPEQAAMSSTPLAAIEVVTIIVCSVLVHHFGDIGVIEHNFDVQLHRTKPIYTYVSI